MNTISHTTSNTTTGPTTGATTHRDQLIELVRSNDFDRTTRLLRLQGWREGALDAAVAAGNAHRLAPAACSGLGFLTAFTGSAVLAAATAASAAVGAVAANHPVEALYNRFARAPIPSNRAAKRAGCATGLLFFAVAAWALATGHSTVGVVVALTMGVLAGFVAATNICVPSVLFTLMFGAERATAATLFLASRRPHLPAQHRRVDTNPA